MVQRLHQITKHRVFTGPAFQVGGWMTVHSLCHGGCWACAVFARCCFVTCNQTPPASLLSWPLCGYFQVTRELCEAAHGGQVLLSHEGWVRLRQARGVVGRLGWGLVRAGAVLAGRPDVSVCHPCLLPQRPAHALNPLARLCAGHGIRLVPGGGAAGAVQG